MRLAMLAAIMAALTTASSVEAAAIEVGLQGAAPVAAAQVGHSELGISTGVTFTVMQSHAGGVGVDLVYHYWPASTKFMDDFDAFLRHMTFQAIDTDTWAFGALQATMHAKLVAPVSDRFRPWVQIGAGPYRVNRNLTGFDRTGDLAGFSIGRVAWTVGGYGSVGVDLPASPRIRLGLDASYHHLWSKDALGAEFGAYEIGAHVLFGVRD